MAHGVAPRPQNCWLPLPFPRSAAYLFTKLAESQASDMTVMAIAGHVSKKMLERYSHIRMAAKRTALDSIAQGPELVVFGDVVHQNVHQLQKSGLGFSPKPLN